MPECPNCYHEISRDEATCPHCGYRLKDLPIQNQDRSSEVKENTYRQDKYALVAAFLALFLGWCGAHDYYLKNFSIAKKKTIIAIIAFVGLILHFITQESENGILWTISGIAAGVAMWWGFGNFIKIWLGIYNHSESINLVYHSYDKFIYIAVLALCIILSIYSGVQSSEGTHKSMELRLETLPEYPGVSIGSMIDSLITNPKWEFVSDNTNSGMELASGDTINVSGKISYGGRPATLAIGFRIDSNGNPYVYAMELNGTPQNSLWITASLDRMYELATTDGLDH